MILENRYLQVGYAKGYLRMLCEMFTMDCFHQEIVICNTSTILSNNTLFLYKITLDNNSSLIGVIFNFSLNEFRSVLLKVVRGIAKGIVKVLQGVFAKDAKKLI